MPWPYITPATGFFLLWPAAALTGLGGVSGSDGGWLGLAFLAGAVWLPAANAIKRCFLRRPTAIH